jgi:hypothetical protein
LRSRKGFYLVSPFLGFFFFMISVSIVAFFVTENNQQIDTAKAGIEHDLVFTSYTIQADAFDVYFQNYLQGVLDSYVVGGGSTPVYEQITQSATNVLSVELRDTYQQLYQSAFDIDCDTLERAYSSVILTFNGQRGTDILDPCEDPFCPMQVTAMWPYASRYGLGCSQDEPPIDIQIDFKSRWYYLDAECICCQQPLACTLPGNQQDFGSCPKCVPEE